MRIFGEHVLTSYVLIPNQKASHQAWLTRHVMSHAPGRPRDRATYPMLPLTALIGIPSPTQCTLKKASCHMHGLSLS